MSGGALLTPSAVARRLGVSRSTVNRWLSEGLLPFATINGRRRVTAAALRAWLADCDESCLAAVTKPARRAP